MGTIKFRAWSDSRSLIYDNVDIVNGSVALIDFDFEFNGWCGTKVAFIDDAIIEQFTGLTDKNEEEIFQGDIVKSIPDGNVYEIDWFDDKCGWFGFENTTGEDYIPLYRLNCVKIGNIHEEKGLSNGND